MTHEDLKFENYGKKYPFKNCVFHNDLLTIKSLPLYLKMIVSTYIDEAERNPEVYHINSLRVESHKHGHEIYYSHAPKEDVA